MATLCYSALIIYTLAVVQLSHGCKIYDFLGDTPPCCYGKIARKTAPSQWPSSQSPAGGPAANLNAVVCYFYRNDNCLICRKGVTVAKCCTAIPTEPDDKKQGGPTPYNEYLIDIWRNHTTHFIDWYNLNPRKEDPLNGYYAYNETTLTGRRYLGLHPGMNTLGCVTVIDEMDCWATIMQVLDMGTMRYNARDYRGFLYVIDTGWKLWPFCP